MRSPSPAVAGAIALPCLAYFFGASLVMQFLRPDYDWAAAPLSFYLLGPYCVWLIVGFFALAAGVLCVALGLHTSIEAATLRRTSLTLFVLDAIGICVVSLVHTDTAADAGPTTHGLIHYVAASIAFLSVTLGMLTQSWRFRTDTYWRRHFRTAFPLAVITFAALLTYVVWRGLPRGAAEKAVILLIVLWLLLTSRWLMLTRQPRAG